ncbi:OmpA family protein [Brevundimonas sp.]|uniref:OmpA family protein n=1 Tax=Brevundimonas sp. TaxID=1871086 RepID=UPI0025D9CBFB|nr:OmpA family protein [Brevundimonas sp.]
MVGAALVAAMGLAGCDTTRSLFRDRSELVAEPAVCVATTLPVYFDEGNASLTGPARELIATTAQRLSGCEIRRVQVVGLASASGGATRNLTLSERRAMAVTEALAAEGWPAPVFEVMAAGEDGAVQGGVAEPVRRRVELLIEAAPGA